MSPWTTRDPSDLPARFHTRGHPVTGEHEEPAGAVRVHRVVGVHLVDQWDRDAFAGGDVPSDRGAISAGDGLTSALTERLQRSRVTAVLRFL